MPCIKFDMMVLWRTLTLWCPSGHIRLLNGRALCTTCDIINLNLIRYSWLADSSTRLGLSTQWSGLDINDIPTSQIEKQRYQFWYKNGGKVVRYAYDFFFLQQFIYWRMNKVWLQKLTMTPYGISYENR